MEKKSDKKCFYSSVKDGTTDDNGETLDGHIGDKDYLTKISNEINMKNMVNWYEKWYEKLSWSLFEKRVLLLTDKLDTCHYFRSPGLSWDAMLKMTGVKLEKMSDIDMDLFIEKELRGGISYIAKRLLHC